MQGALPTKQSGAETARCWAAALAFVLPVVAATALAVFEVHNDDFGFHVATGRWVRTHGEVPQHNPFTYVDDSAHWVQHQWIPAVLFSWSVDHVGVQGTIVLKALLVALCFAALAWGLWRLRVSAPVALALLAVAVAAAANRFYIRPYLFSLLSLSFVVPALLVWRREGLGRSWLPWLAAGVTVVALHLHAGGLYSWLAWVALAAGVTVERFAPWARGDRSATAVGGPWMFLLGLTVVAILSLWVLAPSGLRMLTLPFSFSSNTYWNEHLVEFRPLPLAMPFALQWLAVAVAVVGVGVALWRRRAVELFLLGGFVYLGVRHMRLTWPLAVATAATVGAALQGATAAPWRLPNRVAVFLTVFAVGALAAAGVTQSARFRMGLGEDGIDRRHHPIELMERAASLPAEAFVSDGLAGMWLWRNFRSVDAAGAPLPPVRQHRVLVHNCLECYEEATYVERYQHIRYGEDGWRTQLAELNVRTALLKYTSPGERRFQEGRPNLRQHLFADDGWRLVVFDDAAELYVRAGALPEGSPALPERFPVDPDNGQARADATYGDVKEALETAAAAAPHAVRALGILAYHAHSVGDMATLTAAVREMVARQPDHPMTRELVDVVARLAADAAGAAP